MLQLLLALIISHFNFYQPIDNHNCSSKLQKVWENQIYKKGIETVLIYNNGSELSFPIIQLDEKENIYLRFDEIGTEVNKYSYSIVHCNSSWQESDIDPIEYIEGYPELSVDDYSFSQNTLTNYINYKVTIPNEECKLLISGNYIIKVYEKNQPEKLVLIRRFYVYEPMTEISAYVDQLKVKAKNGLNQRINLKIICNSDIENPTELLTLKIIKNQNIEKNFSNVKPTFVNGNVLEYRAIEEIAFAGGNEYRHFDLKNFKFISDRILKVKKQMDSYHVLLRTDEVRFAKEYRFEHDLNGQKLIKLEKNEKSHIMADYGYVYFTLDAEMPLQMGDYYIFGAISDWKASDRTKMKYNFDDSKYEAKLFLKQGYYNYIYRFITDDKMFKDEASLYKIEGNFYHTENEYSILIYYKDYSLNYEKLVGFTTVNSTKTNNY